VEHLRVAAPQARQNINSQVAWLSLDAGDNDPARFLTYLVAALQTVAPQLGAGMVVALQSPQAVQEPAGRDAILTTLLNEISTLPNNFILVLDDYHTIDAAPKGFPPLGAVDGALSFLVEHLPPQLHLVIATREDPPLPLARLRARNQLTELRVADLRFTHTEAADFLNRVMGLTLTPDVIAAIETRTEGWIAGLQLAALALQGMFAMQGQKERNHNNLAGFIQSFTGSHRFVMDYLIEEVLQQQPARIQTFLLRTSILDRLCGPLCDAVVGRMEADDPVALPFVSTNRQGQTTLADLEQANLFIIPLDNERRWYRYHHLFADFLRQRLHQSQPPLSSTAMDKPEAESVAQLHIRASTWYEENGLEIEAFQHATAAHDIDRAARLIEGEGMPLLFRGAVAPVLNWLKSLPTAVLDNNPVLWVIYASAHLFVGQLADVEQKVAAAEAALAHPVANNEPDDKRRDLIGHIASIRATLAVVHNQAEDIIFQSQRALAYLHKDNLPVRTATTWTLGVAYQIQGDRVAASRAYTEAIAISQAIGHMIITISATIGLGNMQEADNQLGLAAQTYQQVLQLVDEQPLPIACEAHLGLARICYEWNKLAAAHQHLQQAIQLAKLVETTDRVLAGDILFARLKLAEHDVLGAAARLAQAAQTARQRNFVQAMAQIAATQVLVLLRQKHLAEAAQLAQRHELVISQARVHLAQGNPSAARTLLAPFHAQMEAKGWADERLKVMVLQTVAHYAHGATEQAVQLLGDALALAEPGGFIRLFVDEGLPMAQLLSIAAAQAMMPDYIGKLLAAFADATNDERRMPAPSLPSSSVQQPRLSLGQGTAALVEPLSARELEILHLIAQGRSNLEISKQLFLALDTVKGHNRRIFAKLQVQRRTEAVAKARDLALLSPSPKNNTPNQH